MAQQGPLAFTLGRKAGAFLAVIMPFKVEPLYELIAIL